MQPQGSDFEHSAACDAGLNYSIRAVFMPVVDFKHATLKSSFWGDNIWNLNYVFMYIVSPFHKILTFQLCKTAPWLEQ